MNHNPSVWSSYRSPIALGLICKIVIENILSIDKRREGERERKKLYELNRSIFITNKIIESTRVTRENWNKVQLLENNLTRLNYNGERERER